MTACGFKCKNIFAIGDVIVCAAHDSVCLYVKCINVWPFNSSSIALSMDMVIRMNAINEWLDYTQKHYKSSVIQLKAIFMYLCVYFDPATVHSRFPIQTSTHAHTHSVSFVPATFPITCPLNFFSLCCHSVLMHTEWCCNSLLCVCVCICCRSSFSCGLSFLYHIRKLFRASFYLHDAQSPFLFYSCTDSHSFSHSGRQYALH